MEPAFNLVPRYWGKANQTYAGEPQWHPLVYHCLDVAAAGRAILLRQPALSSRVGAAAGMEPEDVLDWMSFLLALHDLGKFADGFQNQLPELFQELQGKTTNAVYRERHDTLGYRICRDMIPAMLKEHDARWNATHENELWDLLDPWISAVTGHHGRPPALALSPAPLRSQFPDIARRDVDRFVQSMLALFLPDGVPFVPSAYDECYERFPRLSWVIAGLAVAADWIGSNQRWFPYCIRPMSLADYWRSVALPQAEAAVAESGLFAGEVAPPIGLQSLFPIIVTPTPLQHLAESMKLPSEPQLVAIEEVTGGGKTEAGLILAHRLMAMGLADGLYMALPTMATANAMYGRVRQAYRKLFAGHSNPSLVLAHSSRRMVLDMEEKNRADGGYGGRENSASQDCAAWLADSRKKALLAHVGVGTIDQALLAILAVRHQSLRLFGLVRKVLIVDEVHACDAYMHRLLCTLLQFHAAHGGSAILLSATLPQTMRKELVNAYADGAEVRSNAYPLLTQVSRRGAREFPVEARKEASRRVEVKSLHTGDDVVATIQGILDSGKCACWVRNTVHDALEAYRTWVNRLGPSRVMLFHARFALGDRLTIEQEVLRRFGLDNKDEDRQGVLVIATQVVEQSLDLDFDFMVTDLAPIDLIIQRAGRLQRHQRGNRGQPLLGVFMPEPSEDVQVDWYKNMFPKAASVYTHHGQLWLTASWLNERRAFAMPDDARSMIEAVYGETARNGIPSALQRLEDRAEGEDRAEESLGRLNSLKLAEGYRSTMSQWQDDAYAPTRLGDPTVTVRLARCDGAGLLPWFSSGSGHDWELSQISIRKFAIGEEDPGYFPAIVAAARRSMPDEGRYCLVIPLQQSGGTWSGRAWNGRGETIEVIYDAKTGLEIAKGDDA